jgi:K+/H+ antiporter YhaU regulatory subunit KhtT
VTLKHEGESVTIPRSYTVLREGDVMIIGGSKKDLDGFDLLQK